MRGVMTGRWSDGLNRQPKISYRCVPTLRAVQLPSIPTLCWPRLSPESKF